MTPSDMDPRDDIRSQPAAAPELFINRELSWLAFNRRVLEESQDPRNPLLERIRFLSITASNLDEFFEIRVAGLLQKEEAQVPRAGPDGLSAHGQLEAISVQTHALVDDQYRVWREQIVPALAEAGIRLIARPDFTDSDRNFVRDYYRRSVHPVLTPISVDPAHPFPHVKNLALCYAALMAADPFAGDGRRLGIVSVPRVLPRFVRLSNRRGPRAWCFLGDVIAENLDRLFRGVRILGSGAFRVTRNSELYVDEERMKSLVDEIEDELRRRRRGAAVRLEVEAGMPREIVDRLLRTLDLGARQLYAVHGPVNLARVAVFAEELDRPDLRWPPLAPATRPAESPRALFASIRDADQLLHHPFESFGPVVDFVRAAVDDPDVLAIKQTLYRTGRESPILAALMEAAELGKEVTAVVELKARFDEESNIYWARMLEEAGVHVVHGVVGYKAHAKLALIVRREPSGLRSYAHIGTGNYNPVTARQYTDIGLFTAREDIVEDVAEIFNALTSPSAPVKPRSLLAAPWNLLDSVIALIRREAEHARRRAPARIVAKMNGLLDPDVILALYDAAKAGVRIDLIVRGPCALRPGVPELSGEIRVRSVVGRFLEHSRIFSFDNGGDPEVYIGSADWMPRNLRYRVEVMAPVADPRLRQRLRSEILSLYLADNVKARELSADGTYRRVDPAGGAEIDAQHALLRIAAGEPVTVPDAFAAPPAAPAAPQEPEAPRAAG